ncbi:MAG: hypothetical protein IPF42_16470 [Candidatus Microthrix sp.]|jgi:hypothetical protein|nr:hypothetical protein [Candidatus Microthrix sp.]
MNTIQTLTGPSTTATGSSDRIIDGADDVGTDVGDLTTDAMTVAPPRALGGPNLHPANQTSRQAARRRRNPRADLAEGVISTAIAVLVIAFLGLLMWVGFRVMFNSATTKANQTIEQIGN